MTTNRTPSAELEFISPELASDYLAHNMRNRNVSQRRIGGYVRQMKNDEWIVTHAAIAFDWDGELIDGQQRLMAIVQSQLGQWMFVVRGLNPDARYVIDTGRPRSVSDALSIAGYPNTTKLAGMARVCILWEEGAYRRSGQKFVRSVSITEVMDWCEAHPEANDILNEARSIAQLFPTPSIAGLAAAMYILDGVDSEFLAQMKQRMKDKALQGRGDPLFALESRLAGAKARREYPSPAALLFFYFRTWNALRDGERLLILKAGETGGGGAISIPDPH